MSGVKYLPRLADAAALLGLGLLLTASDCHNSVIITPPVNAEICNNGIDDDGNGLTDCRDPVCFTSAYCRPALTINPVSTPVAFDTLTLTGTQQNAASITASISPVINGRGGSAVLSGSSWSLQLTDLINGTTTVTLVAVDSTGALQDTLPVTFTVVLP